MTSRAERVTLNMTAQNLLRILIASYFLAVGLNLIPGTDLAILTEQVVPSHVATPLAAMVIFALAFLVMVGLYMRPAALVLGLLTFFASYLKMMELGVADELGTFWRDLVLIAALMLTYAENAPRDYQMRRVIRRKITPRRVVRPVNPDIGQPLRLTAHSDTLRRNAATDTVAKLRSASEIEDNITNIFCDDRLTAS